MTKIGDRGTFVVVRKITDYFGFPLLSATRPLHSDDILTSIWLMLLVNVLWLLQTWNLSSQGSLVGWSVMIELKALCRVCLGAC